MRAKLNLRPRLTMAEFAKNAGLPIVYLADRPPNFPGYLDSNDEPRFIAVNRDLPAYAQAFFIAGEVAFCAQQRRCNSIALDRPWKWAMLDAAPEELRDKLLAIDAEYRAQCFMLLFSTGDEFRAFIKADPKRLWSDAFTSNIVGYQLSKLWAKIWLRNFCRKLVFVAFPSS